MEMPLSSKHREVNMCEGTINLKKVRIDITGDKNRRQKATMTNRPGMSASQSVSQLNPVSVS